MASGDTVLILSRDALPGTDGARVDARAGGSTPGERYPVVAFPAADVAYMDVLCQVSPSYDGAAALTVTLPWVAASATSGAVRWDVAVRRLDTGEAITGGHTYAYQSVTSAAPGILGVPAYATIALTNAQADGIQAGEMCMLRIRRDTEHADDDAAGDAQLLDPVVQES